MQAIPVFFCERMSADSQSFSPSAAKPSRLVELWMRRCEAVEVLEPEPVTRTDFDRVHDPRYVARIFALRESNGFGNCSAEVAASLPYTSAAMLAAARKAIANRRVAVAPCSGFHHACHASGGGYCTFNGLMVAAAALLAVEPRCQRVGILDCDHHYGNGTDDILKILNLGDGVRHCSAGKEYRRPTHADEFLQRLEGIVRSFADCDVLLYQAGADPHVEDPLGGWLTTEQLRLRDAIVFRTARDIGLPVAWNLAGGYQEPLSKVLDIHTNTLHACIEAYADPVGGAA